MNNINNNSNKIVAEAEADHNQNMTILLLVIAEPSCKTASSNDKGRNVWYDLGFTGKMTMGWLLFP